MRFKDSKDLVKLFCVSNQFLELDLDRIEQAHQIDLGRKKDKGDTDSAYYPQFEAKFRDEAKQMAKHYEIFYCLEKSIRDLIVTALKTVDKDWWETKVPQSVRDEVKARMKKEADSGVTFRSEEPIEFTTFGELSEIIKANWKDVFASIFNNLKAVERVMGDLNTLRAPIAHCGTLAEDEVLRLQLSVRNWFRLMQ